MYTLYVVIKKKQPEDPKKQMEMNKSTINKVMLKDTQTDQCVLLNENKAVPTVEIIKKIWTFDVDALHMLRECHCE